MLFSDDEFEEPIDVFYQRLSKLADYMLADPDLNMYLCVIQYPFAGGTRLREAPDLIPKWCGYFPTNVMDEMIHLSQCVRDEPKGEWSFMLGSKSFVLSLDYDDHPEMVYGHIKTNNETMWNIFQGIE